MVANYTLSPQLLWSQTQPVSGFLIDRLTYLSSLHVTAGSDSFTKSVLGVMKWPSSSSVCQIQDSYLQTASSPGQNRLFPDCWQEKSCGGLWRNMNASLWAKKATFYENEVFLWKYKISTLQRAIFSSRVPLSWAPFTRGQWMTAKPWQSQIFFSNKVATLARNLTWVITPWLSLNNLPIHDMWAIDTLVCVISPTATEG